MKKADRRYLELHGNQWRAVVDVPRKHHEAVGATKLKKSLGTDSLTTANTLKWSVIKELKDRIAEKVNGTAGDPVLQEALKVREQFAREHDPRRRDDMEYEIGLRASEIRGYPIDEDRLAGEYVYNKVQERRADLFFEVARGVHTPLMSLVPDFHRQVLRKNERTKKDDLRALKYLDEWCRLHGIPSCIETVTRKVAGRFVGDMTNPAALGREGDAMSAKTANKYISSLSGYWRWLEQRGHVDQNVWSGQSLHKEETPAADRERPFSDDEMIKLLRGEPGVSYLGPIIRIGALTGARIDAIVDLKVKDCQNGTFRFKPQKREKGERLLPIHSSLLPVVAALTTGKRPDEDLFPELPVPPKGSGRERSMPASKAFTRYRKKVGVDETRDGRRRGLVNFHSFRRWFATKAEQAGQPPHVIEAALGHKRGSVALDVYSSGPGYLLRACVEAVKLPDLGK